MTHRKKLSTIVGTVLGIGVIAFVVIRGAVARGASQLNDPTALVPEKDLKEVRAPLPQGPTADGTSIDLLDLLQFPKDVIAGVWGFQDRALITSGVQWGRLQVPVIPPQEYDLSLKVSRKRGVGSLNIGFVQNGRQGMLVVDADEGKLSYFSVSDTGEPADDETRSVGKVLKWNRECRINLFVRNEKVAVTVDGKTLIEYQGRETRFAFRPGWNVAHPKALFLGTWESIFRIDEMTLKPITGTLTPLR
jgi:hypothetical protein